MVLGVSRFCAVLLLFAYACYLVFQLKTHTQLFEEQKGDEEAGGEEQDEEVPRMTTAGAMLSMGAISVVVALASAHITGCIEGVADELNLSHAFLAMIVLPIAGNACEHMTAVIVAMRNKMDLAVGVAVGSSLQIALLALPLCIVVGWATGRPMGLALDPFSALALTASVIHASIITSDAISHWLQGVVLCAVYAIVAVTYWVGAGAARGRQGGWG
jgi:Ca2+:H+ antiporter